MKLRKIIFIITLVLVILGVGINLFFIINNSGREKPVEDPNVPVIPTTPVETETYEMIKAEYRSDLLKHDPKKKVEDYTVSEVIAVALYKLINAKNYSSVTEGTSKAFLVSQKILGKKVVTDNKSYVMSLSSGIVKTCYDAYVENDKVTYRKTNKLDSNDNPIYDDKETKVLTIEEYVKLYGSLPTDASAYVFNTDTYLETPTITKDNDKYIISVDLKPNKESGPYWYQRSIMTNSGSEYLPEFSKIHIDITIDSEFRILKYSVEEVYKIYSIIAATANTTYTETFDYEHAEFPAK